MMFMEARPDHRETLFTAICATMAKRVQQRTARILFAIAAATCFQPLTGLVTAGVWLFVFLVLQGLEAAAFRAGRIRNRTEAQAAFALILVSKLVFALLAVPLAVRGGMVGIAVGMMLISGALIHAVLASGSSRLAAGAATAPAVIVLAILPPIMMAGGVGWQSVSVMACASVLLCCAAFTAWCRVSEDMLALEAARHLANRNSQAKSDFLTMISHEIRTPLNGVMGMAQSLNRDVLTTSQRDRLETLISSGRGLHELIAEVLDLSRIESGLLPLHISSFDLRDTVERSIEPFRAIACAKGLEITVSLCPGLAPAYLGDAVRIRQILHNLISNAIQLTDRGDVLVSASRDSDGVRLSVCDSGCGVPESHLTGIFDKYALLDPARPRADGGAGLGLGLFMTNALVLRMGGEITATNRIPAGLCLTAALPLAPAKVSRVEAGVVPEPLELPRALRVLAAEDHPVNRKVLALLLEQIDVAPTMVENGLKAVQACRDEDWDMVLMDIQMPVLDGVSAARQIGEDARASGRIPPPIIAITANIMAHQLRDYTDAGMAFCVPKPVEAEALFTAMRDALDDTANATGAIAPVAVRANG